MARRNNDKDEWTKFRLAVDEKAAFQQAAKLAGISLSAWIRERLRTAAVRELEQARLPIPFLKNFKLD